MTDPLIGVQVLGYRMVVRLGQGSFGTVYRGERVSLSDIAETNSTMPFFGVVAIKCIERHRLSASGRDNLVSEIATLKKLTHPNIVQLVDFWWDHLRVYLLTEFCAGGDLATYLHIKGALPEHMVQKVARQLVDALYHLYKLNFVHLDLKPQNILLTSQVDFDVKLADFGFARKLLQPTKTLVGSLLYMSPEMVRDGVIDHRADLWSLGTVLYECVYAIPLFASKDEEELVQKLTSEEPVKLPLTPRTSPVFRDLLFKLLQRSPGERLSFEGLHSHPFIASARESPTYQKGFGKQTCNSSLPRRPTSLPVTSHNLIDAQTLAVAQTLTRFRPECMNKVVKALHMVQQAIEAENFRDWQAVCQLYTDSVELTLPIYQSLRQDQNASVELKTGLRQIIDKWLKKGEDAKRECSSASNHLRDRKETGTKPNAKPRPTSKPKRESTSGVRRSGRSSSK